MACQTTIEPVSISDFQVRYNLYSEVHGDYTAVVTCVAFKNFSQITDDPEIARILSELYPTIHDIDLWVGGLIERKINGSSIGPIFDKSVDYLADALLCIVTYCTLSYCRLLLTTFFRLRDGDRFWYQRNLTAEVIPRFLDF